MTTDFEFKCSCCNEIHKGIPTFGAEMPLDAYYIPKEKRDKLIDLGDNDCVIEEEWFYLRGCIEIAVHGYEDPFIWGAWVQVQKEDFIEYVTFPDNGDRSSIGPYYTRLSAHFAPYKEACEKLNIRLHPKAHGTRPFLELEPTAHEMSKEQQSGIGVDRLKDIYEIVVHGKSA